MGILKGILISQSGSTQKEQQELIQGGAEMKYQGISILKRPNCKTWYARYRHNGKQVYVSAKTQQMCYDKLKLALKNKDKKALKPEKQEQAIKLIDWFNKWLKLYKTNVKPNTLRDFNYSMNYLKSIHNKALNQIKPIDIIEILNTIQFERRKQIVWELLNALFDKAIKNNLINHNIMLTIEKPKHKKINGLAFSNEDEIKLIKILKKQNLDIFLVGLYQGLRRGELLALTINDINFENKTITINKGINENNELDTTKNKFSNRIIPLFNNTLSILEKYKNTQGRLFNYNYNTCGKLFKSIIKKNFDKHYTMHSLRHTFITKCKEANIPEHIIQTWVGHEIGSTVTKTVYTHTRKEAEQENINKFNEFLNSN